MKILPILPILLPMATAVLSVLFRVDERRAHGVALGGAVLHLGRVCEVDEAVGRFVIDAGYIDRLPDQRLTLAEDFFSILVFVDITDDQRSGLATGNG